MSIEVIISLVGLALGAILTVVGWMVHRMRDEAKRAEENRSEVEKARHETLSTKIDGVNSLVGAIERRVDQNQTENRGEFRRLHDRDNELAIELAHVRGQLRMPNSPPTAGASGGAKA